MNWRKKVYTGLYLAVKMFSGENRCVQVCTVLYMCVLGKTGVYIGLYLDVKVCTGDNRCVLVCTGLYRCVPVRTDVYKFVLSSTGVYWCAAFISGWHVQLMFVH